MNFLLYFGIGIIYSLLFPLVGGYFSHFVLTYSLIHSLIIGLIIGLSGYLLNKVSRKKTINAMIIGSIICIHFGFWAWNYSYLLEYPPLMRSTITATFIIIIFLSITGAINILHLIRFKSIIVIIVLGLLILKTLFTVTLPINFIQNRSLLNLPEDSFGIREAFYPLSVPLQNSLNWYGFLISFPEVKEAVTLVLLDSMRNDYLNNSVNGKTITPNIDALAEKGRSFNRYYVQSSWTKTSTSSLFTGLYPHEHGICLPTRQHGQSLPEEYLTLAERLKQKNYYTIGSVFAPHLNSKMQFDQGFDHWIAPDTGFYGDYFSLQKILLKILRNRPNKVFIYFHMKGPHAPYGQGLENDSFWKKTPYYRNGNVKFPNWNLPAPEKFTDSELKRWHRQNPDEKLTRNEIRILRYLYMAQLNFYDKNHVKGLLTSLESLGILQKSLVAVTGDHGEDLFDIGYNPAKSTNRQFGHIGNLRELVISPPLVLKLPRKFKNKLSHLKSVPIIESLDITSTIADFANTTTKNLNGESLLQRKPDSREFALSELCGYKNRGKNRKEELSEVTREDLKTLLNIRRGAFIRGNHKLLHDFPSGTSVLFNVKKDPDEKNKISDKPLKKKLLQDYRSLMDGNNNIKRLPGQLKRRSEEQIIKLKGLGYLN